MRESSKLLKYFLINLMALCIIYFIIGQLKWAALHDDLIALLCGILERCVYFSYKQLKMSSDPVPVNATLQKLGRLCSTLSTLREQLNPSDPNLSGDPSHPFLLTITLRQLLRQITEDLELKRKQVQLKKEKIEKSKSYLEGLEYYKSMLQNRIQVCHIGVEDVKGLMEIEDVEPNDWIAGFNQATLRMKQWIEDAKRQRAVLAAKKLEKEKVDAEIKKRKRLYGEELPSYLSKLEDNFKSIMNVFEIPTTYLLNPVTNQRLLNIYSYLIVAKQSKLLKLDYQDEVITLTISPCPENKQFKLAAQLNLNIEPKQIKINIQNLKDDLTVIAVDRSCDFSNEEIFHRLVNDQPVIPIYPKPHNEEQRNSNARFVRLDWVEGIADKSLNLKLSAEQIIDKVAERAFSIQLVRAMIEGLKTNKLNFYMRLVKQSEYGVVNLKKLNITNVSKITWEQARQQIFTPYWVAKLSKFFVPDSQGTVPFKNLVEMFNLQQTSQQQQKYRVHDIYRMSLTYNDHNVVLLLIIPTNYPESKSIVKILHYSDRKQKQSPDISSLPRLAIKLPTVQPKNTASDFLQIQKIERQVNDDLNLFLDPHNQSFYVLYQVNRLLTVLEEASKKQLIDESKQFRVFDV